MILDRYRAQDPPAEYPFVWDSYARPMAPGDGARRGPTPAVPRAARLPAPVAATGQVAARGARARRRTRTPGTGVAPLTSGSL